MKKLLFILGFALAAPLFADHYRAADEASLRMYRQSLRESRENYRAAVRYHGPHSREAMNARMHLMASRRTFHARRRAAHLY